MRNLLMCVFLLLSLTGCASIIGNTIMKNHDEFDNITYYRTHPMALLGGGAFNFDHELLLSLIKTVDHDDNGVFYNIKLDYKASDWLFIESGESLILLVDGERIGFKGRGSSNSRGVLSNGNSIYKIEEEAIYNVTPEQILKVVQGEEVKIKIEGRRNFIERHFNKGISSRLNRFLCEVVDEISSEMKNCDAFEK